MGKKSANQKSDSSGTNLGFDAKLWLTADKLRNNMDSAMYKHGGRIGNMAVYWKKSNSTTRRLAMMNLAIRDIEGDIGPVYSAKRGAAIKTNLKGLGYGS